MSAAAANSLQLCLTLCDPMDSSSPDSPVHGILQARTLEWVAIFSNAWKWKLKVKSLSRIWLLVTPWTAAHQAPLSMGFSRQEYWVGCHCLLRFSLFLIPHTQVSFTIYLISGLPGYENLLAMGIANIQKVICPIFEWFEPSKFFPIQQKQKWAFL